MVKYSYELGLGKFSEQDYLNMLPLLSPERREKSERYRYLEDKIASAKAYLLLKEMLEECYNYDANPIFEVDKNGKPFLKDNKDIFFSIAHDRLGVACAVSNQNVGIDIQPVIKYEDSLAREILSEVEYDSMPDNKEEYITRLWTLKESRGKVFGEGVNKYLRITDFSQIKKDGKYTVSGFVYETIKIDNIFISVCYQSDKF